MRDGRRDTRTGIVWDLPDHDHRVAPTEAELWEHATGVDGSMDADWLARAACTDSDPELFFPLSPADCALTRLAVQVCASCPVRAPCLQAALGDPRTAGIWGGTTEEERAAMRRPANRRASAARA
jgi:WhiB family redox-sensing transcriptional regulator